MWAKIDKQFSTPPPTWRKQRPLPSPMSERKRSMPTTPVNNKGDLFHIIHKVPAGDSPYVRAKHIQLIEKDPSKAVSMFWAAINAGDRVDSALKDMAVVMKQLDRSDEAIEAIKSFRHLCPYDSQESLDNVLIELYKRSGRIKEEIEMLQHKLKNIEEGVAFGGAKTKMARSQGKKIQITIEQERSRILGNLAWAYLQQNNYEIAEQYYRKALSLEPDKNKQCNLAICLMHMNRMTEAKSLLQAVRISAGNKQMDCSYAKSFERAIQMLTELESSSVLEVSEQKDDNQENQSPFPFPAKGNSNLQVTGSTNGGQNHTSTFYVSRSLENGHDEETPLIKEQDRTAYFQKHHKNKNGVFGYDEGSLKCISYGPRRTVFDGRRKGSYRENHACGRSSFANRMKGNCTFSPELGSFLHQKTYAAPAAVRRNLEFQFTQPRKPSRGFSNEEERKSSQQNIHTDNSVLFTQPRRSSSCGFNIEDQRGGKWGEKSVGSSIRKLTFEQAITAENVPVGALRNVDGVLLISTKDKSEIGSKNSRTPLPSPTNEDWTTRSQKGISQVKDAAVSRRPTQEVVNGDWQGTCWKNEGLVQTKNQAVIEFGTQQISHGIQRMNIWGYGDDQPKFELEESNSSTTSVIVDNAMGAIQSIAAKQKSSQDLLTAKDKKTWADMVEEEERESLSERNLRDCLHGFNMEEEEFNDENLNSNIVYTSPCPQNQIDYLSQKLEDSFDVKDDGHVRSKNAAPLSRNLAVRRSLCFDQPQKQELTGHFFSSPLPNKGLKFENRNSAPVKCKDDMSGIRRNRLQVFRDITPFPDSP